MANFVPSGGRRESVVEWQAKIFAACSSFMQIGFRPEMFTINNLHSYGYTENKFLDLIKPVSSITNPSTLRYIFNTALQSLYDDPSVTLPARNEFCDFVNCINWLKSNSLPKMRNWEMSKADVALARKLVDSAAPLTQECKRIESEIDELKKRLIEVEAEYANMSAELKLKLGPIYGYEEPSIAALIIESYLLYEENCRSRGQTSILKLDEMAWVNLVDVFGGTVKERRFVNFLNDPVRKELIETYLKGFDAMGGDGY